MPEDNRTPEQLEAYARECARCADEEESRANAALKTAEDWRKLAGETTQKASRLRAQAKQDSDEQPAPQKAPRKGGRRARK
jgi:hypothetical protein